MRCSLSHQRGLLLENGVKILKCYIPLVRILLMYCHNGQERNCLMLPSQFKLSYTVVEPWLLIIMWYNFAHKSAFLCHLCATNDNHRAGYSTHVGAARPSFYRSTEPSPGWFKPASRDGPRLASRVCLCYSLCSPFQQNQAVEMDVG
jgi:hypothetical protein